MIFLCVSCDGSREYLQIEKSRREKTVTLYIVILV